MSSKAAARSNDLTGSPQWDSRVGEAPPEKGHGPLLSSAMAKVRIGPLKRPCGRDGERRGRVDRVEELARSVAGGNI